MSEENAPRGVPHRETPVEERLEDPDRRRVNRWLLLGAAGLSTIPTWTRLLAGEQEGPVEVRSVTLYHDPPGQLPEGPSSVDVENPYTGGFVDVGLRGVGRDAQGPYAEIEFSTGGDPRTGRYHPDRHAWTDLPESYRPPPARLDIQGVGPYLDRVSSEYDAEVTLTFPSETRISG